ncbi:ubiquitin-like protease 4 [Anaeramoeba flamelloides]|uniref:Ubiquitin-like protease 4 n=1 Tax=Anaeramoeba flamelloides TaxID=1746091 RepID=A0ABQ8YHQ8_9EUKA|nr:ubiquitin-like protease 4 [Anaeramoeba flamelloides]
MNRIDVISFEEKKHQKNPTKKPLLNFASQRKITNKPFPLDFVTIQRSPNKSINKNRSTNRNTNKNRNKNRNKNKYEKENEKGNVNKIQQSNKKKNNTNQNKINFTETSTDRTSVPLKTVVLNYNGNSNKFSECELLINSKCLQIKQKQKQKTKKNQNTNLGLEERISMKEIEQVIFNTNSGVVKCKLLKRKEKRSLIFYIDKKYKTKLDQLIVYFPLQTITYCNAKKKPSVSSLRQIADQFHTTKALKTKKTKPTFKPKLITIDQFQKKLQCLKKPTKKNIRKRLQFNQICQQPKSQKKTNKLQQANNKQIQKPEILFKKIFTTNIQNQQKRKRKYQKMACKTDTKQQQHIYLIEKNEKENGNEKEKEIDLEIVENNSGNETKVREKMEIEIVDTETETETEIELKTETETEFETKNESVKEKENQNKRIETNTKQLQTKLLKYPLKGSKYRKNGIVTVYGDDLKCLEGSKMLNDSIINFYCKYLYLQVLQKENRKEFHFFNSFFYSNLESLTKNPQKRERWTKKHDLLQKSFWVLPVNRGDHHWILLILCYPNNPSLRSIFVFNSLKNSKTGTFVKPLQEFFTKLWNDNNSLHNQNKKQNENKIQKDKLKLETTPFRIFNCVVPIQKNGTDCGLFVLQFLENFIQNIPTEKQMMKKNFKYNKPNWFNKNIIKKKRSCLKKLITNLMSTQITNQNLTQTRKKRRLIF